MTPLPLLRADLGVERAAPLIGGAPCWTVIDPVANSHYQLGAREIMLLGLWKLGTREALARTLDERGVPLQDGELDRLLQFLDRHGLVEMSAPQSAQRLAQRDQARRTRGWRWLLHHYLFLRVPLVRPAAFLQRTLPLVARLWSLPMRVLWALMGLAGGYLVMRQWDTFAATFADLLTLQGAAAYAVAIVLVKVAHECGHAYAATRFGCPVPTMGVAVMLGVPMLYSDTTASWRLPQRSARVLIDAAGMLAELAVAVLATFLWVFLPDGPLRGAVFVLATSSWVMSLVVNLNPFMRFDGYYLLSDAVGLPNLQPRAFALARWHLREVLLGLGDAPPEVLPRRTRTGLIAYAWTTWLYRLVLYAGIALAVYHFFFKALGVVLFAVEVGWFLLRPLADELRVWWQARQRLTQPGRAGLTLAALVAAIGLTLLPLDRAVSVPAVLAPLQDAPLHAGGPARIAEVLVSAGQPVQRGQVLVRLAAPDLDQAGQLAQTRAGVAQARLDRIAGTPRELAQALVLAHEVQMQQRALQAVAEQRQRLEIRAPFDGRVVDLDPALQPGLWVDRPRELLRVVSVARHDVRAYVPETEVWRLQAGRAARFIADDPGATATAVVPLQVAEIGSQAVAALDLPMLASVHDGPIATREDPVRGLVPVQAQYPLRLTPVAPPLTGEAEAPPRRLTGWLHVDAQPQSLLSQAAAQVLRVLAREADL